MDWQQRTNIQDLQNRLAACAKEQSGIYYSILETRPEQIIVVVRDDLLCGGTKSRILADYLSVDLAQYDEYVYASNWYGGAQVALALVATKLGKKATIFTYADDGMAYNVVAALLGAQVFRVTPESGVDPAADVPIADAYAYAKADPSRILLPSGFLTEKNVERIADVARRLLERFDRFDECWCAVGSGALIRGLQRARLAKRYFGVCVYQACPDIGEAVPILPNLPFSEPAEILPPYPSASHYDAKVWEYVQGRTGRILLWNVM